jgi:hypothetical protein
MSYINSFIAISEDSSVEHSIIPQPRGERIPIHLLQYNLLSQHPYLYDHFSLIFEIFLIQKGVSPQINEEERKQLWNELFSKGHPCMRASALVKQYGFGVHYDKNGKMALFPVESDEYKQFLADPAIHKINGMRKSRAR